MTEPHAVAATAGPGRRPADDQRGMTWYVRQFVALTYCSSTPVKVGIWHVVVTWMPPCTV